MLHNAVGMGGHQWMWLYRNYLDYCLINKIAYIVINIAYHGFMFTSSVNFRS